jgi:hypothetical protein
MPGLNRFLIPMKSETALGENSSVKFRHLFSNDLRDWVGGKNTGERLEGKRSTRVSLRRAIVIAVGFSGLLVFVTQVPAFELNIEQTKPAGAYAFDAESGNESKDVAGESDKPVSGTKDLACDAIDLSTKPSTIQIDHWLVLGGVRTARFIQSCSEKRFAWQITQTLEKGEWVMQKVARFP